MNVVPALPVGRVGLIRGELRKLPAFLRRDFLVAWSYKGAFVSDWVSMVAQVFLLYFVGRMVDPAVLPSFGGTRASYLEFVAIGIALSVFVQLGLQQVSVGLRQEQLMGTLESLLMTPTASATIQLGAVVYQLIYVPIRTALFLTLIAVGFGLEFKIDGIPVAAAILFAFIPFVWGLGLVSAAATLTFRRGAGAIGLVVILLTVGSGRRFPAHAAAVLVAGRCRAKPDRGGRQRDERRFDRRRRLGSCRPRSADPDPRRHRHPLARPPRVPHGTRTRAAARNAGALLSSQHATSGGATTLRAVDRHAEGVGSQAMSGGAGFHERTVRLGPLVSWDRVDRLVDAAPTLEDLAAHRLLQIAARRQHALALPLSPELADQEFQASIAVITAPILLERIRSACEGIVLLVKGPSSRRAIPTLRCVATATSTSSFPMHSRHSRP